ncbi:MAG: uracil-DNA glycosylase [Candidatus Microthrix sp.]|uniref:Type-5 uracil-DNA glycosylase n=1 Tax=Candidatus Neomicrothrix subdominans TaxID=2954438 RepID=A0A936N981_9ACTN|nr:uracil-DNA glycosylase [Candidatus Microthrix subdominans]
MDPTPDVEAEAARTLATIADEVSQCRACPRLVEWRERVAREKRAAYADQEYWGRGVPGWGDPLASVAVVGLAPAAHGANRTGRMFCGDRSGEWLYRALWRAGFASQPETTSRDDDMVLSDVWITSPVHCAPPDNKPTVVERDTCVGFLSRELAALPRLSVVVALGGFGFSVLSRLYDLRPRPRFGHGVEVPIPGGPTLLGCYHVSQQNTFTGRLTEDMLDATFARARHLAGLAPHV